MDLDIRSPLDASLLPSTIANIVETGGIRHSDFITDCVSLWTAYPDNCPLCYGRLDPNSDDARDSVWDYLGCGRSNYQDRYIITTAPCGHHYHAGCLHKATDQGSGYSTCLVCRAKWFDTPENLQKARNVNFVITRMLNGYYPTPTSISRPRRIQLESYELTESLVVAAYALRNRTSTYNVPEVVQHSHAILTAMIALARANDGAEVGLLNFFTRLSASATGVIFGIYPKIQDQDPRPEAVILQHFATEVLNMGFGHYLTG